MLAGREKVQGFMIVGTRGGQDAGAQNSGGENKMRKKTEKTACIKGGKPVMGAIEGKFIHGKKITGGPELGVK